MNECLEVAIARCYEERIVVLWTNEASDYRMGTTAPSTYTSGDVADTSGGGAIRIVTVLDAAVRLRAGRTERLGDLERELAFTAVKLSSTKRRLFARSRGCAPGSAGRC